MWYGFELYRFSNVAILFFFRLAYFCDNVAKMLNNLFCLKDLIVMFLIGNCLSNLSNNYIKSVEMTRHIGRLSISSIYFYQY